MNQLITGQYIARKRKEKNMTQAQLAEKLGVSNKAVSKWETGVSHSKRYHTHYHKLTLNNIP